MFTTKYFSIKAVGQAAGFALMIGFFSPALYAQSVHRIVGPDGKISFSDQPPLDAKSSTRLTTGTGGTSDARPNLPFELQQLVSKYPVTLYSAPNCAPCSSARALLVTRGIPHSEKMIETNDDIAAFTRINPENALPLLMVGAQPVKGFSATEWERYLDAAGYPKTSTLPLSYRHPAPQPLVPVKVAPANQSSPTGTSAPTAAARPTPKPSPPAANPNNPTGIKF